MHGDEVAGCVHMLKRIGWLRSGLTNLLRRNERVDGHNTHSQSLGLLADQTTHVAEGLDADLLALDLGSRGRSELVAGHIDHHRDGKLGDSVGVLSRSVHDDHVVRGRRGEVNVVITGSGTDNDLQLFRGVKHFGCDFVGTDDKSVHVSDGCDELRSVSVLLKSGELVPCSGDDFLDPGDGCR